ncbi:hypothetical protein GOODEAATRI_019560 [Goodea atripinnis]|uniref:Uncharacterized protein n=1 Tax=Goodea atripinnis TaxID=208336 RepID=A0ABV0PZC7_9TELE
MDLAMRSLMVKLKVCLSVFVCLLVISFCVLYFSLGFSQSGMGGTMGSSLPPFQTTMTSSLGHTGMSQTVDPQKSSGLFGVENKTTANISGSNGFKTSNPFSSGGPGIHSMDHSAGIRMLSVGLNVDAAGEEGVRSI